MRYILKFVAAISILATLISSYATPIYAAYSYGSTKVFSGSNAENAQNLAVDSSGNVYVTGLFAGTVDFDPGAGTDNKTSNGSNDIFVTKYNSDGTYAWTNTVGNASSDTVYGIATDSSGNVVITGSFTGTVDFDPGAGTNNLSSAGSTDIFVSQYSTTGSYNWTKKFGGTSSDVGYGVGIDSSNNIYVGGTFHLTVDFDPGAGTDNRTSAGGEDAFFAKYNSGGTYQLVRAYGGSSNDSIATVAVDSSSNILITGLFNGTVDFDPSGSTDNHTSGGGSDVYLSKFASDGSFTFAKTFGSSGEDLGYGVGSDSTGNIFVTGYFNGTVDFDPGAGTDNHSSLGAEDVFISKYSSAGVMTWTKTIGDIGSDFANDLTVDTDGNVIVVGTFTGTVDFDPGAGTVNKTTTASSWDNFILSLDSSGAYNWVHAFLSSDESDAYGVGYSVANNSIYAAGYFYNTTDFNPGTGDSKTTDSNGSGFFTELTAPTPTPSPSPTPTATPTPTSAPSSGSASSTTSTGGSGGGTSYDSPASAPTIVTLSSTADSITIKFLPATGPLTGYSLSYGEDPDQLNFGIPYFGDSNTREITLYSLQPSTNYHLKLWATNITAAGPSTPVLAMSTKPSGVNSIVGNITSTPLPQSPLPIQSQVKDVIEDLKKANISQITESNRSNEFSGQVLSATFQSAIFSISIASITGILAASLLIARTLASLYLITSRSKWLFPLDFISSLMSWLSHFVTGLFAYFTGIIIRKKKSGIVFDALSYQPLSGAYVIYFSQSGNLKTDFTNNLGEYAVAPSPDDYQIRTEYDGYKYPSQLIKSKTSGIYTNIYQMGELIKVKEKGEVVNDVGVALDPQLGGFKLFANRLVRSLSIVYKWLFIVVGLGSSILSLVYHSTSYALISLALFVILVISNLAARFILIPRKL